MLAAGASCAGTIRRAVNVAPYHPKKRLQSSEVVLGLPSHSIPNLPMTCLHPCISIASLAPLGYDTGPLLMSEANSETIWELLQLLTVALVAHTIKFLSRLSTVEGYQCIFSCCHDMIDCGRQVENLFLLSEV